MAATAPAQNTGKMKTKTAQNIRTGIFTIAGILLFVAGIFIIGAKKNMFGDTFLIYGTFSNVGGLQVGNNIRFAGINVGTVEDIRIVSDTMIRVDMRMQQQVKPFLKVDALASIGSDGLMGDKLITINSGSANEVKVLGGGARIRTVNPVDFDKVIGTFTNVADNAEIITRELAGMAIAIRSGNGTISKLLYTDDLSRSLQGTATNAEAITGSLAGIASQIRTGKGSVGSLLYTDSLSNNMESVVDNANAAMVTINEAAYGFSENMKALHGNVFLRGYFKRKARDGSTEPTESAVKPTSDEITSELDESDLRAIITEAQKALDEKNSGKK